MELVSKIDSPGGERIPDTFKSRFMAITAVVAATRTLTQAESGTLFTNRGTAVDTTFTLPAVKAGIFFFFAKAVIDKDIIVVSPTGVKIHGGAGATQGETVTNNTDTQYGSVMIWSDGTAWWCTNLLGTWAIS